MFRIGVFAALVFLAAVPITRAQEAGVIASMDEMRFAPPKEKGSASLVDGRVGKAVRFRFEADAPSTFFTSDIHGKPEWDRAQGFADRQAALGQPRGLLGRSATARVERCLPIGRDDRQSGDRRDAAPAERDLDPPLATVPEPDLVTIFFGGNDWDSGMRGAEFRRTCTDAVNRVRRATRGKADVLLITTNPSAARWGAIEELAEACRDAAKDRRAGLADTDRAFVAAGRDNPNPLFVHDRVHLSKAGHAIVAETVIKAIEQEQNPKEKATVTKRSAAP